MNKENRKTISLSKGYPSDRLCNSLILFGGIVYNKHTKEK